MTVSLRHPIRHLHPRQQEVLKGVPLDAVPAIIGHAHLLQNLQGGTLSGCIWQARQEFNYLLGDTEALRDLSRRMNPDAMRACGCSACARDAARG